MSSHKTHSYFAPPPAVGPIWPLHTGNSTPARTVNFKILGVPSNGFCFPPGILASAPLPFLPFSSPSQKVFPTHRTYPPFIGPSQKVIPFSLPPIPLRASISPPPPFTLPLRFSDIRSHSLCWESQSPLSFQSSPIFSCRFAFRHISAQVFSILPGPSPSPHQIAFFLQRIDLAPSLGLLLIPRPSAA